MPGVLLPGDPRRSRSRDGVLPTPREGPGNAMRTRWQPSSWLDS
ncbi:hypothetical protein LC55x_0427 [Lysobacter capsici]|nr:hypothetical protein LC55x_0427 [Lysobacter capsici]